MKKIAFVDVDMALVDNSTSKFNETLLKFLADYGFDEVYLVTGRNANDLWQHVLQQGIIPTGWRNQLLHNIVNKLKGLGINVAAISTPYDHYLKKVPGDSKFIINRSGDAAEQFYQLFEKEMEILADNTITPLVIADVFQKITGGNVFVENPFDPVPNQELSIALPTYLALSDDTEKRGQFEFLLDSISKKDEYVNTLEVFFFDDKPENLKVAEAIFISRPEVQTYATILVDCVSDFKLPDSMKIVSKKKPCENTHSGTLFYYNDKKNIKNDKVIQPKSNKHIPN